MSRLKCHTWLIVESSDVKSLVANKESYHTMLGAFTSSVIGKTSPLPFTVTEVKPDTTSENKAKESAANVAEIFMMKSNLWE
jgi:hypothetical protein